MREHSQAIKHMAATNEHKPGLVLKKFSPARIPIRLKIKNSFKILIDNEFNLPTTVNESTRELMSRSAKERLNVIRLKLV